MLDKDPVIDNSLNSKISVRVNDKNEAIDPKFNIIIPALSFSHCLNFRLAFFRAAFGTSAAPGEISGFRSGGGWIGLGKMFWGVGIFCILGHFLDRLVFLVWTLLRMTLLTTLLPYLSVADLVWRLHDIWFNENKDGVLFLALWSINRWKPLKLWRDWQNLFIPRNELW